MYLSPSNLAEESLRATELLLGKVVGRIVLHTPTQVMLKFTDGSRLFVDGAPAGIELSITGTSDD
jgi:hypothetical protein